MSERIREPGEWEFDDVIDPAELEQLDENQAAAVDGRGGSYEPDAPILIGGRGIQDCAAEQHIYDAATGNVTIGPTDSHRVSFFGANNINGTIVVLINDDAAFTKRTVYVSTLNTGSRVRIRDATNTVQYTAFTAADTLLDFEITVERTELTGTDAWKRVRLSHQPPARPSVDTSATITSSPLTLTKEHVRFVGTIGLAREIVIPAAPNGAEVVLAFDHITANVTFSDTTSGNAVYVHNSIDGPIFGRVFRFWRQLDSWKLGFIVDEPKSVRYSAQGSFGEGQVFVFEGTASEYIVRVNTPDSIAVAAVNVYLFNGAFIGQKILFHHAGLGNVRFKSQIESTIATLAPGSVHATTLCFHWTGNEWMYAGMLPYQAIYS
jgi:hypothetical protein